MARGTDFIRALETHRTEMFAHRRPEPATLSPRLMLSWIHHDNMLEGRLFRPAEIVQALRGDDEHLDKYLHPLMRRIRRYRDTIEFVWHQAHTGPEVVNPDTLKEIHRRLTPAVKDRGGLYRRTSPVHRDYFQKICPADKVPYLLRKAFDQIRDECDEACDPVRFAADIHHQLMHVYPFRRNPGTTTRLFTNLLLLSRGYPPALISADNRDAYYDALSHPESDKLADIFQDAVALLLERAGGHTGLLRAA